MAALKLQLYLWIVQKSLPVIDASSTSTPPICLGFPDFSQFSIFLFVCLFCFNVVVHGLSFLLHSLLTLSKPGFLAVPLLPGPGVVLTLPVRVATLEDGGGCRTRRTGSWSPVPIAVHLSPVRARPQQSSLHQATHHHVREVAAEVFEIHPEREGHRTSRHHEADWGYCSNSDNQNMNYQNSPTSRTMRPIFSLSVRVICCHCCDLQGA